MEDFGKYKIKEQIGIGGTASVYLAEHKGLDRDIILKVMSNALFSHEIDYKRLFVEEAQIIAKLNHPNIVQVYDVHISDELTYIEMEFLSGGTLKERINDNKPFDPIKVIREIALALQYVFNRTGTIHRDIKPSNILFREDEKGLVSVLSDFGIAKTEDTDTEFTNIGVKVGTPRYMSPEHLMGGALDQRSDLYSLGIILYEMLSGKSFNRNQTPNVLESFKTPKLPPEHKKLQPILNKLSAPNPAKRYNNSDELVLALDKFKDYQPLRINRKESSDTTNVLTSTLSKILGEGGLTEPVKKPQYALYALVIAINIAGGAYVYFDSIKKDEQKVLDVEQLEVSLLKLQQNEIDVSMLNEEYKIIRNKYPSDKKVKSIGGKITKVSEKQRRRSLLDSASKLVIDKEYELAENQLSLVLKLSPSEIEKDEVNLIQGLIKKRKKREILKNDRIAAEKKIELEKIKAEEQSITEEPSNNITGEDNSSKPSEKTLLSTKDIELPTKPKKLSVKITNNCHYHQVNAKLIRHCHPNPKGAHNNNKDYWNHTHAAIPRCTNSINHSHKYKDKNHNHKYRCTKN